MKVLSSNKRSTSILYSRLLNRARSVYPSPSERKSLDIDLKPTWLMSQRQSRLKMMMMTPVCAWRAWPQSIECIQDEPSLMLVARACRGIDGVTGLHTFER